MPPGGPPFADREELEDWVRSHPNEVPPLALERLLAHNGFAERGTMPTQGTARCVVWAYQHDGKRPQLCNFRFLVYHTDTVSPARVARALEMIGALRAILRRTHE